MKTINIEEEIVISFKNNVNYNHFRTLQAVQARSNKYLKLSTGFYLQIYLN